MLMCLGVCVCVCVCVLKYMHVTSIAMLCSEDLSDLRELHHYGW